MRVPARMDSRSLWLWVLALAGATILTWLEFQLDPPTFAAPADAATPSAETPSEVVSAPAEGVPAADSVVDFEVAR